MKNTASKNSFEFGILWKTKISISTSSVIVYLLSSVSIFYQSP